MSKPVRLGSVLEPVQASLSRAESCPDAASRDLTPTEKWDFLRACRQICPGFQVADKMKPLMNDILRWCHGLPGRYDPDKGLWLWGDIGTGKSTLLAILQAFCPTVRPWRRYRDGSSAGSRELSRQASPYGFRISNATRVAGDYAKNGYEGIDTYILNARQAFDEVGREGIPSSYFGNTENVFAYIIQRRYDLRDGDFTHVTSNLDPEQIAEIYGDHIYDRCYEMFNFVEMSGWATWRQRRAGSPTIAGKAPDV